MARVEDKVPWSLKKGCNLLLVKLDQADGGWKFCLRLVNENHEPVTDYRIYLR